MDKCRIMCTGSSNNKRVRLERGFIGMIEVFEIEEKKEFRSDRILKASGRCQAVIKKVIGYSGVHLEFRRCNTDIIQINVETYSRGKGAVFTSPNFKKYIGIH